VPSIYAGRSVLRPYEKGLRELAALCTWCTASSG
jgi:hypothetical protein